MHDNGGEKALKLLGLGAAGAAAEEVARRARGQDIVDGELLARERHLVERALHLLLQRVALPPEVFHVLRLGFLAELGRRRLTTFVMRSCTSPSCATTSPLGLSLSSPS